MRTPLAALVRLVLPELAGPDRGLVERFTETGNQAAFAALVERHGPMVLGVCRHVLRDSHLAEDAFQATFLVLARKAGRLRVDGSLASWLFGVARRVALAARRREQRQSRLRRSVFSEAKASAMPPAGTEWDDLLEVLDAELARLPDKYRAPLLACYLHGRTQDEAARELGWSLSTVRRRLDHGRELLRVRMTARGAALSAGLFATALAPTSQAAVSEELNRAALAAALAVRAGVPIPGLAGELAREVTTMSTITKWSLAAVGVTLLGGALIGLGVAGMPGQKPADQPTPAKPPAAAAKRDRYNDPLPPHAIARMGTVGFRHPGLCLKLNYALDGKVLISGNTTTCIWDPETGARRALLGGWNIAEKECAVAEVINHGKELMVWGTRFYPEVEGDRFKRRRYVYDIASGREVREIAVIGHDPTKPFLDPHTYSPAGNAMAAVQDNGDIWLWDATGKPTHVLARAASEGPRDFPVHAAFTPDGSRFINLDDRQIIKVWDVGNGKLVRSFGGGIPRPDAIALSPNGKLLAALGQIPVEGAALANAAVPEKLRIWEIATGKLLREIPWGDESWMVNRLILAFTPDGHSIVVVNEYSTDSLEVRRWRVDDGHLLKRWSVAGPNIRAETIAIHPSGQVIVLGTRDGLIRRFDLDTGKETTPTNLHLGEIKSIVFGDDDKELRTASSDGTVRRWETATGKALQSWRLEGALAQLTRDGLTVLDAGAVGKGAFLNVKVRDAASGEVRREIKWIRPFVMAPDEKSIWAMDSPARKLEQWDLATGVMKHALAMEPGRLIAVSDGGRLIVMTDEKRLIGRDSANGEKRFEWSLMEQEVVHNLQDQIRGAAISADGKLLALAPAAPGRDGKHIRVVCELATGKILWQVRSFYDLANCFAFRPDMKVVAIGGMAATTLYDVATGKLLVEIGDQRGPITALAFSRDGKRLASGGADGTAIVWDVSHVAP